MIIFDKRDRIIETSVGQVVVVLDEQPLHYNQFFLLFGLRTTKFISSFDSKIFFDVVVVDSQQFSIFSGNYAIDSIQSQTIVLAEPNHLPDCLLFLTNPGYVGVVLKHFPLPD